MLFEKQISRKPDLYPFADELIKAMWAGHWKPTEFDFRSDVQDFKTRLTEQEQTIVTRALSAISQIEVEVKEFWGKMGQNLPHPSIKDLGYVMAEIEVTHNKAYEKLLDCLGLEAIFEENLKLDIIQGRVNYLTKHTHKYHSDSKKQYLYSIILFTLYVENVSLFSQFYVINWFHHFQNVLKDTGQQIQYTAKEENLHAIGGITIINKLRDEYPELFDKELEDKILHETKEAFKAESKIIDWIIGDYSKDKINANILKEFIKFRLNDSLRQIKFSEIFDIDDNLIKETIWFDEETLGNTSTDFFFKKPVEYSKKSRVINHKTLFKK